jgi:hypothetical protein
MRTRLAAFALATLAVVGFTASPASAQVTVLTANLTAAAVPTGGDPASSGFAYAVVDDVSNRICVVAVTRGGAPPTQAHIHQAPAGVIGPHAVDLNNPISGGGTSVTSGCYTASEATLDAIAANPSNFYVNIHSGPFPLGSVRGQLTAL